MKRLWSRYDSDGVPFFLLPALLLVAHAEETITVSEALNQSEQRELRRFLSEDVSLFRKEPPLDLVISQARTTRILNNGYRIIEISAPRAKDESPSPFASSAVLRVTSSAS